MDVYFDETFTASGLAYDLNMDKKLVNRILHRLVFHKAIKFVECDAWGVKIYRLNEAFTN
jgi:transcription initiation factor IIE alpha subunit